ncbi:U3 small nucleolar RNA-associated protein 23 [Nematocida sp. LUAm3]|nr:U3 small nucleolar RNA-associated protein 23 [Nematocida sp. LUAm3]KAI5175551.1 U3 small nucleolar RNA-associated protein 23 [Nematocida sp. LUAm2]KAI5178419.1 U3 small nucleolar RNA-associated protein 23 [Nematocida sp. LUAm1]
MRTARLKQIRKLIQKLTKNGFRQPFQILADSNFLSSFNSSQMSLKPLQQIFGPQIKLYITSCEYKRYKQEVEDKKLIGNVDIKKCSHEEQPTLLCLQDSIKKNNPNHYFAAISPKFRKLKEEYNVPIVFMRSGVLCVEVGKGLSGILQENEETKGLSNREKAALEKLFN